MAETDVAPETAVALLETIRRRVDRPELVYAAAPTSLRGGYFAQMVQFSLLDPPPELSGPLVARIVPEPATARWEATLQGGVAAQGFPTPAVRLVANDRSPLGRAVIVMDLVDGHPPLDGLEGLRVLRQLPTVFRHMPDQLAGLAASLHAIDAEPIAAELDALGDGIPTTAQGFVEAQLWLATLADRLDLVRAAERLLETQPRTRRRVVCHGDLHPFNVLVTPTGPVLIDWTVAQVGHPGFTLGFTDLVLNDPPLDAPGPLRTAIRSLGRRQARRFHRTYRALADPADLVGADELAWYRKVHGLRILVEVAGWEAAGTVPASHPWRSLGPVAERELGLATSP